MKYTPIGTTDLMASRIIAGCMRIDKVSEADADRFIHTALDLGINLFDHADVYGSTAGACEKLFGRLVTPSMRDQMILQTKCGVIKGRPAYDFSKEHILQSVDESLQRLHTDHVELLLLHRPDTLADPAEIAEDFEILHKSGKVQAFGVSNQNTWQMELLKKYCHSPQGKASTLTATLPRIVTAEYFPTAGFTISQFRRGRPSRPASSAASSSIVRSILL